MIRKLTLSMMASMLLTSVAHAGINIQQWFTPQGTKVLFVENHSIPMVDIKISFKAGSGFDSPNQTGIANMTNHLLLKGAGSFSESEIAQSFADVGSEISNTIDDDTSNFTLRSLSSEKEFSHSIKILTAIFNAPTFSSEILEREKKRFLLSIQELETRPAYIASRTFAKLSYNNHSYAHFNYGHKHDISKISQPLIKSFYKNYYDNKNAVISIIGDLSKHQAELVSTLISQSLPKTSESQVILKSISEVPVPTQPQKQLIENPSQQSHILMGLPIIKRDDPDLYALILGNYILGGGGFASRLMDEVREKRGYTYGISSYFYPNLQSGLFQISTQTKRESTAEALKLISNLLIDYVNNGPTDKELQEAKSSLAGGFALRTDSNQKLLGYLSLIGIYDLPLNYLDTYIDRIEKITKQDIIQAFQRKIYPNGLNQPSPLITVVVGNTKEIKPLSIETK